MYEAVVEVTGTVYAFQTINRTRQFFKQEGSTKIVNDFLANGWEIIKIIEYSMDEYIGMIYILGKPRIKRKKPAKKSKKS